MSCEFVHLPGDSSTAASGTNTIGIFFELDGNGNCNNGSYVYESNDWVVIVSRGLLFDYGVSQYQTSRNGEHVMMEEIGPDEVHDTMME